MVQVSDLTDIYWGFLKTAKVQENCHWLESYLFENDESFYFWWKYSIFIIKCWFRSSNSHVQLIHINDFWKFWNSRKLLLSRKLYFWKWCVFFLNFVDEHILFLSLNVDSNGPSLMFSWSISRVFIKISKSSIKLSLTRKLSF